jgi:hypothetical protein
MVAAGGDEIELAVSESLAKLRKFSCTYVESSDSYCASLVPKDKSDPNLGKCLTAWSDNWFKAVGAVCWIAENRWSDGVWSAAADDGNF